MAQRIIIIGGLSADFDCTKLIATLAQASGNEYEWEWHKVTEEYRWRPADKWFKTFLWKMQQKIVPGQQPAKVVALYHLHGESKNQIFRVCKDTILPPKSIENGDELVTWLLSADAGLIPPREWTAGPRVTALFCILEKLIRNKSWNKDSHGHHWTQEADLLGQAPVQVENRPQVRAEAVGLLQRMMNTVLLTKGANQGKTKKEWCINLPFRPYIMQAILKRSVDPLRPLKVLEPLLNFLEGDDEAEYGLHEIISEKVLALCREHQHAE